MKGAETTRVDLKTEETVNEASRCAVKSPVTEEPKKKHEREDIPGRRDNEATEGAMGPVGAPGTCLKRHASP